MREKKRHWTVKAAREWVKKVDLGLETLGLKYASAKSFLRGKGKG